MTIEAVFTYPQTGKVSAIYQQADTSGRLYARVMDSIELYKKSRPTYTEDNNGKPHDKKITGLPDVWRINPVIQFGKPAGVQMTADFQWWIYRINCERQYGRMTDLQFNSFYADELFHYRRKDEDAGQTIRDFNSLFRSKASHVNYAGVDKYENFIAGENKGAGLPIYSNIVTGRWVGQLKRAGSNQFKVLNASNKLYLLSNPWDDPELFDEPLNTGREFYNGTNIIKRDDLRKPYDDFGGRVVLPVMLPADDWGVFPDAKYILPSDTPPLHKFG